jgi:hypothetical protein
LLKVVLGLVAVITAFLVYVAFQDPSYSVSRQITISATPERIFPHINNSQRMNEWNPWSALDPDARMAFSGPAEGVGSRTSWDGGK